MKNKRIVLHRARNLLFKVWLLGALIPVLILVIQTLLGVKYKGIEDQIWGWFSPLIFPSVAMMLGVIGSAALLDDDKDGKTVNRFFLYISICLSIILLALVTMIILIQPLSKESSVIKFFSKTNLFIAPIQSLVSAALGFLFSSTNVAQKSNENN